MPRRRSTNKKASNGGASHLPVLVDTRLVKALDHVLRQHILLAAVQGPVSPKQLSKLLNEGLSQVSYHVKVLHEDCEEMIELVHTEPRRGAVEHYYRASAKTLLPGEGVASAEEWSCAPWSELAKQATCSMTSPTP